mmetsp:Transcript_29857/g.45788  ORF Transcript_29857/g.45788 Transcript_29857/m.45788 type:complete len:293 (+) Transcript_29857:120-998(+)|eukprot:CAMPEP_0195291530 /NCGR_PEP_ID=MMETSP0707-20130614/7848_1 /TAXON_ID=33640 /ORGANISM="Asterionellopsis glacialis, Strain CCMP134" /LENGTH=292 /DNA_ID=CAMNT_0040351855 /DNA_START=120 /DNA_END=998 /DNA_ORIENTATION=+
MGSSHSSPSNQNSSESRAMENNKKEQHQSETQQSSMKSFNTVLRLRQSSSKFAALRVTKQKATNTEHQIKVRSQIVKLIENRLNRQKENDTGGEDVKLQNQKLAESLEKHLYRTAPTWDFYADMSTFESRVRLITCRVMKRRERKKQIEPPRLEVLKNTLGSEKYQKVTKLVNEVRAIRFKRCTEACSSCQGSACALPKATQEKPIPGNQEIPLPIRRIFFDEKLVDAYEKANVGTVATLDWDRMIQAAQTTIEEYGAWQRKEQHSKATHLHTTPVTSKRVNFQDSPDIVEI